MFSNAFRLQYLFLVPLLVLTSLGSMPRAFARDCWLSVHGAGLKNGTSRENAYSVSKDKSSAEKCWVETSPDGTLYVLEGRYSIEDGTFWSLKINQDEDGSDGAPSKKKQLIGLGRVSIEGSRVIPYSPASKETGETWLEIQKGARQLHVENFRVSRVAIGILADEGDNIDLSFKKLDFQDTRQNLILYGHPDCPDREHCKPFKEGFLTRHVSIEKVNGLRYSKRHIRLTHGILDVMVYDCTADSQFLEGDFAVGFDVEGPSRNIEFRKCIARGNLYQDPTYWNGDGFKSEKETENIRWVQCAAMDNADAGFDIKSPGAVLDQITAVGNSRNIRIWSQREAQLKNVVSSHARRFGGEGTPSGLWVQGLAHCQDCTVFANPTQIHLENGGTPCRLTLLDSLITAGSEEALVIREEGTNLQEIRTEIRHEEIPAEGGESRGNNSPPGQTSPPKI